MQGKILLLYSSNVLDHFPCNLGMKDVTVSTITDRPGCEDRTVIYLKIRQDNKRWIERMGFESYRCIMNIASASMLTESITGKTLKEPWEIAWKKIFDEPGELPTIKMHCRTSSAVKRNIRAFFEKEGRCPECTSERIALEEDLMERGYARFFANGKICPEEK